MPQDKCYLLCLGVCNTLFDARQGVKNLQDPWQADIFAARDLPSAIPLGERHVLLPRPHLQELIAYIQQHLNLDVAIISGATREYIDKFVGMVAPDLLAMCQFIWSREDERHYYKRLPDGRIVKTLEHIPALKGYQPGKILMVDHWGVFPPESHLAIKPFRLNCSDLAELVNENSLQDIIRRLSILTQVDDIIALRSKEEAEQKQYFEQVNMWKIEKNISTSDVDYAVKMRVCPLKLPIAIDEIEKPYVEPTKLFFDIN